MLVDKSPSETTALLPSFLPSLLHSLSDSSDDVVLLDIRVRREEGKEGGREGGREEAIEGRSWWQMHLSPGVLDIHLLPPSLPPSGPRRNRGVK